jgi:hypothetical protein
MPAAGKGGQYPKSKSPIPAPPRAGAASPAARRQFPPPCGAANSPAARRRPPPPPPRGTASHSATRRRPPLPGIPPTGQGTECHSRRGTRPASTAGPRLADAAGRQRACRRPLRCAGISAAVPACSSAGPAVRPPHPPGSEARWARADRHGGAACQLRLAQQGRKVGWVW